MLQLLFRRRTVWRPTLLGWVVFFLVGGLLGLLLVRGLYPWLAEERPLPEARYLVVEGWLFPAELDQALNRFRAGHYERIITTGGPVSAWGQLLGANDYATVAQRYLTTHGVPDDLVVAVPAPPTDQDRTFLSALKVREWLDAQQAGHVRLDLMTSGAHARRSLMAFRMALGPQADIGILAATPADYRPDGWWRTSNGVKSVIGEGLSVVWMACCFFPPQPAQAE